MEVFKNNPHIEKLIEQKTDSIKVENLAEHFEWVRKKNHCDKIIDFSESIEVALAQHPRGADYKLPREERISRFNKNYYEHTMEWAGLEWTKEELKAELFFDDHEILKARSYLKKDCFNILVGMSGSGTNKAYPYTEPMCLKICDQYPNVHIITIGDMKCKLIEPELPGRITNLSGEIPMRVSMALTSVVDLVIAPDTGITHATGAFGTPLICILGHNSRECITKHFENDYSIEADPKLAPCSPCLFLITFNFSNE